MKSSLSLLFMLLLAVILLLLSSYNTMPITLNYLLAKQEMPLAVALSIFLSLGFVLASVIWFVYLLRYRFRLSVKTKKISKLNQEIELLRLQIKDK